MQTILLLFLVTVCSAQVPQRCDSPMQWEGRRLREDRKENYTQIARHFQDAVFKRTRTIKEVIEGDKRYLVDTLHLYNENKQYKVDMVSKVCNVTAIGHPFRHVTVPPGSRFLFEAEIGPSQIQNEHLTAQTWGGTFEDGAEYVVTVTYPDCVPVAFDVFNNKTDEAYHERYFDIVGGIKDPSVFIPPSECMGL